MPEDFQEKTEKPTQKKLTKARKDGKVAKSQDLTSGFLLLGAFLVFAVFGAFFYSRFQNIMVGIFQNLDYAFISEGGMRYWLRAGIFYIIQTLSPVLIAVFVVAFVLNLVQVKFVISLKALEPKLDRLNLFDVSKFKKFFNLRALVKLGFGLLKLAIICIVCYSFFLYIAPDISNLMNGTPRDILKEMAWATLILAVIISCLLLVIGIIDFAFQKWKFLREMKMSKQEVKDEHKQAEGDPQVKSRMRSLMLEFMQRLMKSNVKHADVVVANPTHYAVAIKYDGDAMAAPMCVAKGARKMALAIKALAAEHNIPIVENPSLAKPLYHAVEVGMYVPPNFYHAVAEVLAYLYRLNEQLGKTE
ncbi:flagellar biosynthesis protein FlhB [Simkania negevensis]|uniref:Flagellar biosynthetic protein FlhB n=1 Tax=Simkania negevensis TaxID=83561 RepID=A0ABS3AQN9_9BACT|nr:flagellar biosynthesis protein FlhB [Simkania negevensis]